MFGKGFITEHCKFIKLKDHSGAATSAVNSDSVDMAQDGGFDSVCFLTSFGVAAADNIVNAAQSDDDGSADDFTDLTGTAVASGASDEDVLLDVQRPTKRYVRLEAARGTSSTLESIWAVLYNAKVLPVDNTTTGTIAGEQHSSPAEGTA